MNQHATTAAIATAANPAAVTGTDRAAVSSVCCGGPPATSTADVAADAGAVAGAGGAGGAGAVADAPCCGSRAEADAVGSCCAPAAKADAVAAGGSCCG